MKKINIREALLKLDKDSCCRYDLTTLYESCKLDDEDKVKLVQYINAYEHPSIIGGFLESKCDCINESYGDDDVSSIAGAEKVIKEINENEVPLIFSDDIDNDDEEVKTIPLTEEVVKSDAKEVRKYVWDKILPFDNLTDDDSYYWEFDQDIRDGFAARLVSDEIDIPDNATYKFSLPEVGLNFFLQDNPEYCYYVIDKDAVEPFSKVDEAVEIGECPICNRKFAEGELNSDGACPKCGEHLHKTDSGAYEKTDDDLDESVGIESIIGWLAEHDQAYDDALAHFKTDDLNSVSESDLIDWIGEHDELYQDYLNFFKLEEGLWDDIKSVGKTVGKVAKKAWDNSYTKAIGTGLKKAYDKSDLGKATKEIGDSIKATDTYKKVAGKVNDTKDFVKNNVGSRQRDPQKLSIEHRGKNYRMSDLKYKLDGKVISPQEYASLGMLKRSKAQVIVPRGAKPIQKESLNLYEAFNMCEDVDITGLDEKIKSAVNEFMQEQGFDANEVADYTAVEIKDTADDMIQVEVRAELNYEDLMELSNKIDPLISELDKNAYFEPVTSGILRGFIRNDQSDDIVDEEAVAQWAEKLNACKSIDDLREVYLIFNDQCDNNQYSGGTIDAVLEIVHNKLDALDESLNEDLNEQIVEDPLENYVIEALGIVFYTQGQMDTITNFIKPYEDKLFNFEYMILAADDFDGVEGFSDDIVIARDNACDVVIYKNIHNVKFDFIKKHTVRVSENPNNHQYPTLQVLDESKSIKEGIADPDEVLNFKRDVESATDLVDIQNLIWSLSDGVAEESIQQAFDENETEDLQVVKDAVIRELDIYLEDNEWLGESINEELNKSVVLESELFYDNVDNCTPEELATFKKLGWIAGRAVVIPEGTKLTYHSSSNSSGAGYDYYRINSTEDLIGFSNQDPDLNDVFREVDKEIIEESKSINESTISSVEPVVKFRGKSSHTFTPDKKWEVDFDEEGNILARTRHGKPYYFSGHINDKTNEFGHTDEDAIIQAAREQHKSKFGKDDPINESADLMIYLFPELTDEDLDAAKGYGLTFLGKNHGADGSEDNWVLRGAESSLRMFADKYLGYELHPDYLYDEDEFAGDIINEEAIELTADEMKAKYGTDNPDIINTGRPEEEGTVVLKETAEEASMENSELDAREQIGRRVSVDGEVGTVIDTDETLGGSLRLKVKVGTEDADWVDLDDVEQLEEDIAELKEFYDDDFSDEELASILGGDTKYDMPDGVETPEETEARLAEDSSDRVITKEEMLYRICELEDFKIDTGIRGSWVSAQSQKPDWNNSAGLVSVECRNDNEVTVYSFAEGARKEIYKTSVHSEEELEALVAKVAEIQQEQLEVYKANPQEHYENSYRYKERAAHQALDSRVDEIAAIVAKYPKAKFNPLNKTVLCASESDANGICNEIDFAKCQISKVRNSQTPYEVNIQPIIE